MTVNGKNDYELKTARPCLEWIGQFLYQRISFSYLLRMIFLNAKDFRIQGFFYPLLYGGDGVASLNHYLELCSSSFMLRNVSKLPFPSLNHDLPVLYIHSPLWRTLHSATDEVV